MKVYDHPWGPDPSTSYRGEPICPRFETVKEMKAWAKKLTLDQQALAKTRCRDDRAYFIQNFCWIKGAPEDERMAGVLGTGWIPFILFVAQLRVIREIAVWARVLSIKVRQIGLTWLFAACGLHQSIFYAHQSGFVFSYDQKRANKLLKRIKDMWKRLPDFLVEDTGEPGEIWSADELSFTNGSNIEAFPAEEGANLGDAYDWGIFDEVPAVEALRGKDLTEMINSAMLEALRAHQGWFVANGTGRYRAGWSWKMAKKLSPELGGTAKAKPTSFHDWKLVFVPITDHPYWTDERIAAELETTDADIFWREHPRKLMDAFAIGGKCVFNQKHLNRHLVAITTGQTPKLQPVTFLKARGGHNGYGYVPAPYRDPEGDCHDGYAECRLYVPRQDGHVYQMALDATRQAASKDYCSGQMLDITTGEQACVIHWKFNDAITFADYAYMVSAYYNWAELIPDVNVDRGLIKRLVERGYPNLSRRETDKDTMSPIDTPLEDQVGYLLNPGMASGSRSKALTALKWEMTQNWLKIYDEPTLAEMGTFIVVVSPDGKREKEEAASGAHDDLVMPLAINVKLAREKPEYQQPDVSDSGPGLSVSDVLNDGRPPKRVDEWDGSDIPWEVEASGSRAAASLDQVNASWFRNA